MCSLNHTRTWSSSRENTPIASTLPRVSVQSIPVVRELIVRLVAGAYESGVREAERVMDLTKKGILIRSKRSIRETLLCEARSQFSAVLLRDKAFDAQFEAYLRDEADEEFSKMLHDLSFKIEDDKLYLCAGSKARVTLNDIQKLADASQWVINKRRKVLLSPRRLDVPQSVPVKSPVDR